MEEEQDGEARAAYGKRVIEKVAVRLQEEYGKGYSALNLWLFRNFFTEYPSLLSAEILYAVRKELTAVRTKKIRFRRTLNQAQCVIKRREQCVA